MRSYGGKANSKKNSESSSNKIYDEPEPDEFVLIEVEPGVDLERLQQIVVYPDLARRASEEGRVIVNVLVGPNGKVLKRFVEATDHELLNQAALYAIDKYGLFSPATQNGQALTCWVSIPIEFRIRASVGFKSNYSNKIIIC